MPATDEIATVAELDIQLDRDHFTRHVLTELSRVIEDLVGLEEAEGFISLVASRVGESIDKAYRSELGVNEMNVEQVAAVLEDLKRRIQGGFRVTEINADYIELRNSSCPFGDPVVGKRSLCAMTSNVFGRIAANNLGYAKVCLAKTIAAGDPECLVRVYLRCSNLSENDDGQDYVRMLD